MLPIGGHADTNRGFKLIRDLRDLIFMKAGSGFNLEGIMNWRERSARLPTTVGIELQIEQKTFAYGKVFF